jgi:S1-C subfamily serine protease
MTCSEDLERDYAIDRSGQLLHGGWLRGPEERHDPRRSSSRGRAALRAIALLLLCVLAQAGHFGCSTVDKRVERLTAAGKFEDALQELEEEGVGNLVSQQPEPSPEALRAREIYQSVAEAEFAKLVDTQLSAGLARKAVEVSSAGARLCQWSSKLSSNEQACRSRVAAIDGAYAQLEFALGPAGGRTTRRTALQALKPYAQYLADSPAVSALQRRAQDGLLADALSSIPAETAPSAEIRDQVCVDLALSGVTADAVDATSRALDCLSRISQSSALEASPAAGLRESMEVLAKHAALERVLDCCNMTLDSWAARRAQMPVASEEPTLALMTALHDLREVQRAHNRKGVEALFASVLVTRAESLRVDPRTAPLSWLYLQQAQALSGNNELIDASLAEAVSALQRAEPFSATIAIDLGPKIEPETHQLLFASLYSCIAQSSRKGVAWSWVDPVHGKPLFRIEISEGELFVPRSSDLIEKSSSYLSHFETVPNPYKEQLEWQLRTGKSSVDFAESRYESAVSSHNVYPTEWSLMSVNSARTQYVMAVDAYNSLVRQYNATPDTISQPVYVPYTYREGVIRAGIRSSGAVWAGTIREEGRHAEVVSDSLRIGAKYSDVNESSRRDDPLDIEIDGESQLRRMMAVARGWIADLDRVIARLPQQVRMELSPDEAQLLSWLSGPFGPSGKTAEALEIPKWAVQVGLGFRYPEQLSAPPTIEIQALPVPQGRDRLIQVALEAACEVITSATSGAQIHQGSGALISEDGLILTCAHVLAGPQSRVRFFEGPLKGEYDAEIVRIDDRSDVALIRAVGIKATSWLSISEVPVGRGTKVAAVASPSVGDGGTAHAAVTHGDVITPIAEDWGQPRLVADLAVASGSSGGPIIDIESGRIVGVVTAVSAIEFNEARASTASLCLAAPASRLAEWIGLRVRPPTP